MVIPTVPRKSLLGKDLAHYDYFRKSLKISGADICMVVGGIAGLLTSQETACFSVSDPLDLLAFISKLLYKPYILITSQKISITKADKLNLKYSKIKINTSPNAFKRLYIIESEVVFSACKAKYIVNINNYTNISQKIKNIIAHKITL
ncbi:hypothetical protein N9934_04155 [Desulfosarcina sp.]|nr:hypothetical protein [Desulfosarcina sp.]